MSVPSNLIPTRITQLPIAPVASEDSILIIVYDGNTYQIRAGDLLSVAGVPVTRQVIAGTGLTGGGQLLNNVTLSIAPGGVGPSQLANTGVSPGTYGSSTTIPVYTVDAQGRITASSSVAVSPPSDYVPNTRQVIAGTGLTGGGALNTNVTLNANLSNAIPLDGNTSGSAGTSSAISRADHRHPAVDLSDTDQVDNVLGLSHGGTARSLVMNPGAVIWSGADGLYVGPAGAVGQALISGGTSEYTWSDVVTLVNGQSGVVVLTAADVGAPQTDGTGATGTWNIGITGNAATATSASTATNLAGGAANRVAYQTGSNTTSFISAPVSADTFLKWTGSGFTWGAVAGAGTVTSVDGSGGTTGMTLSGGPITAAGTLTLGGTLIVSNGGTGLTSYTVGDTLYYSAGNDLSKLAIGSNGYIMTSTGSAPQWSNPTGLTVGNATNATNATTATNIANGSANQITYQTAAGTTSFITAPTVANTFLEWSGSAFQWSANPLGTVTSVGLGLPGEFSISNSPVTTSGTLTGAWVSQTANYIFAAPNGSPGTPTFRAMVAADVPTLNQNTTGQAGSVANSVTFNNSGSGDASGTTYNGSAARTISRNTLGAAASGANADITSMTGVTGGISSPDFIQFDAAVSPLPTDAIAKLYYNNDDQFKTMAFQMDANVVQKIGEEQYFRIKCSAPVSKGQVVMFTGTLGASGGLTGAPATGLTADQANYILGIATEAGSTNDWIFVTCFGEVKGIDTTGGVESWVQGQVLYYNPAVTGGLTDTKPNTPNAIAVMASVVHVNSTNGILFVRPVFGSVLGGTDGNVQFGTLNNGDVIVYDSTDQRWENVAQSTLAVGTATNVAGGGANQIVYNTAAGTSSFITAPTVASTYLEWSGSAFQWSANPLGTVTSITAGSYLTGGTITTSGTIAVDATTTNTANKVVARDASGDFSAGTITASLSGTATNATNIGITDDTSTNATMYPVWVTANTGNLPAKVTSSKLSFNPSTGALTATGGISGGTF